MAIEAAARLDQRLAALSVACERVVLVSTLGRRKGRRQGPRRGNGHDRLAQVRHVNLATGVLYQSRDLDETPDNIPSDRSASARFVHSKGVSAMHVRMLLLLPCSLPRLRQTSPTTACCTPIASPRTGSTTPAITAASATVPDANRRKRSNLQLVGPHPLYEPTREQDGKHAELVVERIMSPAPHRSSLDTVTGRETEAQ